MYGLPAQYLRGIELFNTGKFFECHEALEELWLNSEGVEREFLQTLIHAAAALHHFQQSNYKGAKSVYERTQQKFAKMPPIVMELDTRAFAQELERFFSAALVSPDTNAPLPQIKVVDADED